MFGETKGFQLEERESPGIREDIAVQKNDCIVQCRAKTAIMMLYFIIFKNSCKVSYGSIKYVYRRS